MSNDITIPPEALEAAYNARRNGDTLEDICLAMLSNWPHRKDEWRDNITFDGKPVRYSVITLPLPKENTND